MERCLIVDFGSQYTQLIARTLRELKVFSEIVPPISSQDLILDPNTKAVILSGGPSSVGDQGAPRLPLPLSDIRKPVLGICYGMQLMAKELGGKVESGKAREYGVEKIQVDGASLLSDLSQTSVLMSHGDHVASVPAGFRVSAKSQNVIAMMESREKKLFGIQFHPEVTHSPDGTTLLQNFLKLSGFQFDWESKHIFEELKQKLEAQVKTGEILCAVSGGVDSVVLALLLQKIFPGRVHSFCVDTGLMRKNEIPTLREMFEKRFHFPIHIVDAREQFLGALKGVEDPEQKRKIIGKQFIDIFESEARAFPKIKFLAQGTLYPDVIESISAHGGGTAKIKSHHNVGGLPADLKFDLVEPFRFLFKDEVRKLGTYLEIPNEFVERHPFPGPGLAVRVLGDVTEEKLKIVREADAILQEILKESGWYSKLWQSFCVYLPVRSVGVMGDGRTYEHCLAVRCVHSEDGMTAHIAALPSELLERMSARMINEVRGINRVVYDISSKPPSTIEWE